MDGNSVGSTIEKIKLQEQDKEIKLKEKREYETTVASLHKAIREATIQAEKSEQEQKTLINKINTLQTQMMLEKIRRNALHDQLQAMKKELEELKNKSNAGILKVWEERSTFCKEIQCASDKYDVWALLTKPVSTESFSKIVQDPVDYDKLVLENQNRLKAAIERRNKAIAERDRLKASRKQEPECGEEFVRIKNALRYSLEKIEEVRKGI